LPLQGAFIVALVFIKWKSFFSHQSTPACFCMPMQLPVFQTALKAAYKTVCAGCMDAENMRSVSGFQVGGKYR
jgi:hypothetical protein